MFKQIKKSHKRKMLRKGKREEILEDDTDAQRISN